MSYEYLGRFSLASSSLVRTHWNEQRVQWLDKKTNWAFAAATDRPLTLANSGVLKLMIFPNSLAWKTDFTLSWEAEEKGKENRWDCFKNSPGGSLIVSVCVLWPRCEAACVLRSWAPWWTPRTDTATRRSAGQTCLWSRKIFPWGGGKEEVKRAAGLYWAFPSQPPVAHLLVIMRKSESLTLAWAKYLYLAKRPFSIFWWRNGERTWASERAGRAGRWVSKPLRRGFQTAVNTEIL